MSENLPPIRVDPRAKLLVADLKRLRYLPLEIERDDDAIDVEAIRIDEPLLLTQGG